MIPTHVLGQLSLAYALSVHKSQGSEYPSVVLTLLGEHAVMLQRNLLYTAVTRARRLVVIVGSRAALLVLKHRGFCSCPLACALTFLHDPDRTPHHLCPAGGEYPATYLA
jgi:hypothetical protein